MSDLRDLVAKRSDSLDCSSKRRSISSARREHRKHSTKKVKELKTRAPILPPSPISITTGRRTPSPLLAYSVNSLEKFHLVQSPSPSPNLTGLPRFPSASPCFTPASSPRFNSNSFQTPSPTFSSNSNGGSSPMNREGSIYGMNVTPHNIWNQPIRSQTTPPIGRLPSLRKLISPTIKPSLYSFTHLESSLYPSPSLDDSRVGLRLTLSGRKLEYEGGKVVLLKEVPRCRPYSAVK